MREELYDAWRMASSIESMTEDTEQLEEVGTIVRGNREFVFYKSPDGNYWYRTRIKCRSGFVSEYEEVFGKTEKKRWRQDTRIRKFK